MTANGTATVSVLLGIGDGAFAPHMEFSTGANCRAVAIGDMNGDGKPDLVTANYSNDYGISNVSVLLGRGNGTFGRNTDFVTGSLPQSIAIGDLNGDGNPDIATANGYDNTVSVLPGAATATSGPSPTTPPAPGPTRWRSAT